MKKIFIINLRSAFSSKHFRMALASLIIVLMLLNFFKPGPQEFAQGASFTFTQTDWTGGYSTATGTHPGDRTGWTKFSTSTYIDTASVASNIILTTTTYSTTDDGTLTSTASSTGGGFSNGAVSTTTVSGSGSAASITLSATTTVVNAWDSALAAVPYAVDSGGGLIRNGADDTIYVMVGNGWAFLRYSISGNTFTALPDTPALVGPGGKMIRNGSEDSIYVIASSNSTAFMRFSISGNTWTSLSAIPLAADNGANMIRNSSDDTIYVDRGNNGANFYSYSIAGATWTTLTSAPAGVEAGAQLFRVGSNDTVYLLRGSMSGTARNNLYTYSISGATWTNGPNAPAVVGYGSAITSVSSAGDVYLLHGNGDINFSKFSTGSNTWSALSNVPDYVGSGGAVARLDTSDLVYAFPGAGTAGFFRYSVSGATWTSLHVVPGTINDGSGMISDGNNIFITRGGTNTGFYRFRVSSSAYYSSGNFTSAAIDMGASSLSSLTWTSSTPSAAGANALRFQLAVNNDNATWSFKGPDGTSGTYFSTSTGSTVPSTFNGNRYLKYKAFFATANTSTAPTLYDFTVNFSGYRSSGNLVSSVYDSGDPTNVMASITFAATQPASTSVKFQLRSASTTALLSAANFVGPDGTSTSYFTDPAGGTLPTSSMRDGVADRYFQYKAFLSTTLASSTPQLDSVTVTYVVNMAPEIQNVTSTPNNDGTVTITYQARDTDTASGTVPYRLTPTFQYCPGGSNCQSMTALPASSTAAQTITANWTNLTATWTPATDFPGRYDTGAVIKVTVNDGEAANATAFTTSSAFILDSGPPTTTAIIVDASTTPAVVSLTAADTSSVQMQVSLNSDMSGASWVPFTATSSIALATDPDTVYARFKDAYGNTSAIVSASTPESPTNMMSQDISNLTGGNSNYRLFIAWKAINPPSPAFGSYRVYRSLNQSAWTLLSAITDINVNYYADFTPVASTTYYYKVLSADSRGDISTSSPIVSGVADGVQDSGEGGGGVAPAVPPVISNVATSSPSPSTITITWDTDSLANSTVGYSTTPGNFTDNTITIASMLNSDSSVGKHKVVLSGLAPNTHYYFQVQSAGIGGSTSTAPGLGNGYEFTTPDGVLISGVANPETTNNTARIIWTTTATATSYVVLSQSINFNNPLTVGSDSMVTSHAVNLSNLTSATHYYYYVYSVNSQGVTSTEKNVVGGIIDYFSFNTTNDTSLPVVSNIDAIALENRATITWNTNKNADTQMEYGTSTNYGTTTTLDSALTITHAVSVIGLNNGTTYHFRLLSRDVDGNLGLSAGDHTFNTLAQADTTSPMISNIVTSSISLTSATISWNTDENSNALVEYGTSQFYYSSLAGSASDFTSTTHSVTLNNLAGNTTYYFRVKSQDVSGNAANSGQDSFITTADVTAPSMSSVTTTLVSGNAAVITWSTNENADSQVIYGTTASYGNTTTLDSTFTLTHAVNLNNLSSGVTYHYRALSKDSSNNLAISSDLTFATLATGDTTAPVISGVVTSSISLTSATISWNTDENANALVEYGTSQLSYSSLAGNASDFTTTSHSVTLNNLAGTTQYYFRVKSQDISGNVANSGQYTFTTVPDNTPPVITDTRTALVSDTSAVITWSTDELADSEIFYGTDNSFGQSNISATLVTGHSPSLSGLTRETTYFYKVVSKDLSHNEATDDNGGAGYSFTTTKEPVAPPPPGGGGGAIVDMTAPTLSGVQAAPGEDSATITWSTSEAANGLVRWGTSIKYDNLTGNVAEDIAKTTVHSVVIKNLDFSRKYYFQAVSYDSSGNLGQSDDLSFTTLKLGGASTTPAEEKTAPPIPDSQIVSAVESATKQLLEKILAALSTNPSLKDVTQDIFVKALTEMTDRVVDAPTIVGPKPSVEVQGTTAIITWSTDKKSSSAVSYARNKDYNAQANNPYTTMAVNPDEFSTFHKVQITGLDPGTLYHYQVISKGLIGPEARSWDNTFTTSAELPTISEITLKKVKDINLIVNWKTNLPTSAELQYTNLKTNQILSQGDATLLLNHSLTLKNLDPGVNYQLIIKAKGELGEEVDSMPLKFTTGVDLTPPTITNLSSESTLYPGKESKVQTILSWETDKPADSQVFYQEGVSSGTENVITMPLDISLTQKHIVVITKFKPGTVYRYWVQSRDMSGNLGKSEVFSVLTPQEKQTILDIIINNFEQVFGWTRNLKI